MSRSELARFNQRGHRIQRSDTVNLRHFWVMHDAFKDRPDYLKITPVSLMIGIDTECGYCGERQRLTISYEPDSAETTVSTEEPCTRPDGVLTEFFLDVPSGKLVVGNDMRDIFEISAQREQSFFSYNTALGQHQYMCEMAAIGCAYGVVGNSSPGVYKVDEGHYQVANFDEDDSREPLTHVITDLWAYCMTDLDRYTRLGGKLDEPYKERTVIDVPSGLYMFTHHTGEASFDWDSEYPVIYTDIELTC